MQSTLLNQVVLLNNDGIRHLQSHNIAAAMCSFQEGIVCLQQTLPDTEDCSLYPNHCLPLLGRVLHQPCWKSTKLQERGDDSVYVYNEPILLDEARSITVPNEGSAVCRQVASVLLFNLALTYHRECACRAERRFHQAALQLYQMALSILELMHRSAKNCSDTSARPSEWYTVLMVVILNNCAAIYYQEECDYPKTLRSTERIISLMSGEDELFGGTNLLSQVDLDGIVTNASMLDSPVAAQAA